MALAEELEPVQNSPAPAKKDRLRLQLRNTVQKVNEKIQEKAVEMCNINCQNFKKFINFLLSFYTIWNKFVIFLFTGIVPPNICIKLYWFGRFPI